MRYSQLDAIMYADDGIVFCDEQIEPEFDSMSQNGIFLSDGHKKDGYPKCG